MNPPTTTTHRHGHRGRSVPSSMHEASTSNAVNSKSLTVTSAHPVPIPHNAAKA
jgi:hypothetical protein